MTTFQTTIVHTSPPVPLTATISRLASSLVKAIGMCLPSVGWPTPAFAWARSEEELAQIVRGLAQRGYRAAGQPVWSYVPEVNDVVWRIGLRPVAEATTLTPTNAHSGVSHGWRDPAGPLAAPMVIRDTRHGR